MSDVLLSKWWTTKSCQDACERAAKVRAEKLAKLREAQKAKKEKIAKEAEEWVTV